MIRAPFILHTVENTDRAQASHVKWYLAPFSVFRCRVYTGAVSKGGTLLTRVAHSFDYARPGQYLGSMMEFAGKFSWRQF